MESAQRLIVVGCFSIQIRSNEPRVFFPTVRVGQWSFFEWELEDGRQRFWLDFRVVDWMCVCFVWENGSRKLFLVFQSQFKRSQKRMLWYVLRLVVGYCYLLARVCVDNSVMWLMDLQKICFSLILLDVCTLSLVMEQSGRQSVRLWEKRLIRWPSKSLQPERVRRCVAQPQSYFSWRMFVWVSMWFGVSRTSHYCVVARGWWYTKNAYVWMARHEWERKIAGKARPFFRMSPVGFNVFSARDFQADRRTDFLTIPTFSKLPSKAHETLFHSNHYQHRSALSNQGIACLQWKSTAGEPMISW